MSHLDNYYFTKMVVYKPICGSLHKYSTQIVLVFVFFLVLFTFVSSPIRTNILQHQQTFAGYIPENGTLKMESESSELTLPYQFTAEECIKEGRVSSDDVEEIRTFVSNLNDKYVPAR